MTQILRFDDTTATARHLVGGKAANLALLTQAGFPVPFGFALTTGLYAEFIQENKLAEKFLPIIDGLNYDDVNDLDVRTAEIRNLIEGGAFSATLRSDVGEQYAALGDDVLVAVRSSGTAEDLDDASFAGQHDTYLHIKTLDGVLDATKRCWASMWTARATAYRQNRGIDHLGVGIAVAIQTMVDSQVSGVMFVGNPSTTATDEIVVNASWGLGEAIVEGIVTPDEYTVSLTTLRVKEKTLGSKKVRTVIDPSTGTGTITADVPESDQARASLSDSEVADLAELGRRVTEYMGGFPQDIEWGLRDGKFYLLQSRPITGVEFAWEADLEDWQPTEDEDVVWTRTMADMVWTGAVTPLFFTLRGRALWECHTFTHGMWGLQDSESYRYHKYWKGTPYYNTKVEVAELGLLPPPMRAMAVSQHIPSADDQVAIVKEKFSYLSYLQQLGRIRALFPGQGVYTWLDTMRTYLTQKREEASGLPNEKLQQLSDAELIRYTEKVIAYETKYILDVWNGFIFTLKHMALLEAHLVQQWYDGGNPTVMSDLATGQKRRSATVIENLVLWDLSKEIRDSRKLHDLFVTHRDGDFFRELENVDEGRAWLAKYSEFLKNSGHRGHSDRDIYYPRRIEDPSVDYRAFEAFLSVDESHDPEELEERANNRRKEAYAEVLENIGKKSLGFLRAEVFKIVHSYMEEVLVLRDDHRDFVDICTFTSKRAFVEINRRLLKRGLVDSDRDIYFLGKSEVYDLFAGRGNITLLEAKISARMKNFDLLNAKEVVNPMYLKHNRAIDFESENEDESDPNVLRGVGTSRGITTGTARILKALTEIGKIQKGDILVVNATDPGWTPAFFLINGLILEGGGLLSHGASLSREYGIPSAQLPDALRRIPDGATITLDGSTGQITIVERPASEEDLKELVVNSER